MILSSPSKILIGISLDAEESVELLSWAIRTLAQPNDTVIALHVLVAEEMKKRADQRKQEVKNWRSIVKYKTHIRQAKAFVISVMGEFAKTCQSKQVNLEARVALTSSVGRGLIEEAKGVSTEFLLIGSSRVRSNRFSDEITKYCLKHTPDGCSLVLVGKCERSKQDFHSDSIQNKEFHKSVSRKLNLDNHTDKSFLSVEKHTLSPTKRDKPSPRSVLQMCEGQSQSTEEDSSICGESSIMASPPLAPESRGQKYYFMKQMSPLRHFLRSPFDSNGRRKRNGNFSKRENQQPLLRCFSYEEIANATNYFHPDNLVGRGGYSEVYRGDLEDGQTIAVKRLTKNGTDENKEKEFLMELGIIGHVNHPNTASLVGCCMENGLYLIFNFYPNGTLSSALHGKTCKSLEWQVRYKIALGVARGLHYLHTCCKHRIIHRDIKASNVLLDPDYEPQISDFGLAKWLPSKWTHHAVIPIEGTFGYLAPEYFMHGIVDEKTDVFAFGVLLLEIITGRRPVDSSKQSLVLWAKPLMDSGSIHELVDVNLEGRCDKDQMRRLVLTASYCVRQSSIWRPSMTEVLELLTSGDESEAGRTRMIQNFTTEEMDDYSMVFGYELPSDISLEDTDLLCM